MIWLVLAALVFGFAVDVLYVYWTRSVVGNRALLSATMSGLIQFAVVGALWSMYSAHEAAIANIVGHAAGSYVGVKLGRPQVG